MKKALPILVSLIVCSIALVFLLNNHFGPNYDGYTLSKQVNKKVSIRRDQYGVPKIHADNFQDAYFGLGYVHAQDRLFQLTLLSRLSQGTLSELLGPKLVKTDKFFRTLGIRKTIENSMKVEPQNYNGQWMSFYKQYLAGINHYIESNRTPIEFKLLGKTPQKFEVVDLLSISGYLSFSFAVGVKKDPLISTLQSKVSPDILSKLFVDYNPNAATSMSAKLPFQFIKELNQVFDVIPPFIGSNSWVVSGSKSTTGKPVLANDPHIGYANPSVWFEADIHVKNYKSHGYYLAGFPFALVGHTSKHAWALTMLENDDLDLYSETIDKTNKTVVYKNQSVPLKHRKEVIQVAKGPSVEIDVYETPHGPLVNQFLKIKSQQDKDISLFWEYYHPKNNMFEAFHDINHASTMSEFRTGVSKIRAPGLNISYTDHSNIAWWAAARLFKRKPGNRGDHLLNGSNGEDEIEGYLPFSENPHQVNPQKGYIFTANGQPRQSDPIEGYFMPRDRSDRISQLLQSKSKLSIEDHKMIQNDNVLLVANKGLKVLLSHVDIQKYPQLSAIYEHLRKWDQEFSVDSIGSTIYMEWSYQFLHLLLKDLLNENELDVYSRLPNAQHLLDEIYSNQSIDFLNQDFKQQVSLALQNTNRLLTKKFGPKTTGWTWGKYHTIEYSHAFSKNWLTKPLFNLGPYPIDGVKEAINSVSAKLGKDRFFVKSGPSVRRIVDMSDVNNSYSILPTGNSGNPFSDHYDDQVQKYLDGKYRKVQFTKDDAKGMLHHFEIKPLGQ
ncbi:MAG: penicillin acylase family protein [Candidatus Cloacimonetes bacterium]|nr:penicillin acylase family protein [Candidatus Cloacimonadota bacterium]